MIRTTKAVFAGSALALAACAVDSGTTTTNAASANGDRAPAGATAVPLASEDMRIDAYLAGLYDRTRVVHSFESDEGHTIDCLDYEAEPGVQAMLAQGLTLEQVKEAGDLTPEQKKYNASAGAAAARLTAFKGDLDMAGNARACPGGSVAHPRYTREHVKAQGGLDAFLGRARKKTRPVAPLLDPSCPYPDLSDYQWVETGWPATGNQGGQATLAIAKPTIVYGANDHSLAQVWLAGSSGCTEQTVEVGWTVADGVNGDLNPHVFMYSTASSYGSDGTETGASGCYNNDPTTAGIGGSCVKWSPPPNGETPQSIGALPYSVVGGAQHELAVAVSHPLALVCTNSGFLHFCHYAYTGWQMSVQIDGGAWQSLGLYVNTEYGTGPLSAGASSFTMGTEVSNSIGNTNVVLGNPNVTMGEGGMRNTIGLSSMKPFGTWSYIRNYSLTQPADATGPEGILGIVGVPVSVNPQQDESCATFGKCVYNFTGENAAIAPSTSWTNWYWYGDNLPTVLPFDR